MDYESLRGKLNDALATLEHLLLPEDRLEINEALRCTAGGYGDVYRAILRGPDGGSSNVVAVKELRSVGNDVDRIRLAIHLARELRIWAKLNHPNVLELIGYYLNPQMTIARFISPFITNGNIDEYLENAPSPVSDDLRIKLLRDSLEGLVYLHSLHPPICHADIKPENVLITDQVEAVLCDFGLASLADGQPSGLTTSKTIKGSTRYMSPELLDEDAVHTLSSDIWAYACLVLKVMTGSLPYSRARTDQRVLLALAQNQLPAELTDLEFQADKLKTLLVKCWNTEPSARPSASECRQHLPITGGIEPQLLRLHHQIAYQPSSPPTLDLIAIPDSILLPPSHSPSLDAYFEMPLSREELEVTSIIKNLLDNCPAGSATLREILQNTDDAGAKTQTFILDTRSFDSNALVDSVLGVCQGPAIIATNDAYFQAKDWVAIKRIHNSSKTQDESSAGKNGFGFRSCYHITDNPHILSHDKLLILDPHQRVDEYPGGFELKTTRSPEKPRNDRDTYAGHFAPFAAIFKHDDNVYQGTAIRLPLRLPDSGSKIKSTATSIETVRQMFDDFINNELPESMLFLKHITTIELKEIDTEGNETLLATAKIDIDEAVALKPRRNRGKEEENSHHKLTTTVQIGSSGAVSTRNWIIVHFVEGYHTASNHMVRRLGRRQADIERDMVAHKLFPHVALAMPVPENGAAIVPDFHGRLFTLLPLPIITGFPLHINAVLALTSSRQNLRNAQDLVRGTMREFLVEWNRVIFSELVPKAWASLLEHLVTAPHTLNVFEAWPTSVATREGDPGYWFPLPSRLLEEAARRKVWPSRSEMAPFSVLDQVVVAVEGENFAPLAALESCKVPLIFAPARVFKLINESKFKGRVLAPETAQLYIKKNVSTLSTLDATKVKSICDYLASANNLGLLISLPIIPNVRGGYTAITTHFTYTMATNSEASVFRTVDRDLLAADSMSAPTRQLLLNDSAGLIHAIQPANVARYLQKQVGTLGGTSLLNVSNRVTATTVEWLIQFWSWLDGWDKFNTLVNDSSAWSSIQKLHALPLRGASEKPVLRLVERSAVRPDGADPKVVAALAALEIPVLHGSMPNGSAVQRVSKPSTDVVFILQNVPRSKSFSHLDQDTRKILHDFFTNQLSNYLRPTSRSHSRVSLDADCRRTLRTLPIFPIFNPGVRTADSISFGVAPEGASFIDPDSELARLFDAEDEAVPIGEFAKEGPNPQRHLHS